MFVSALGGASIQRKGEANSFFQCFCCFKVIMKQLDKTSYVIICLVETPRVCAIAKHFMTIYTSLDRGFFLQNLLPEVKGFLCSFQFLMFFRLQQQ